MRRRYLYEDFGRGRTSIPSEVKPPAVPAPIGDVGCPGCGTDYDAAAWAALSPVAAPGGAVELARCRGCGVQLCRPIERAA